MTNKKFLIATGTIVGILILAAALIIFIFADPWIESKIKNRLGNLESDSTSLHYKNIDVDLLASHLILEDFSFKQTSKNKNHLNVSFDTLEISGLGVFSFIFNNKIALNKVKIKKPNLQYIRVLQSDSINTSSAKMQLPHMLIKELTLENGTLEVTNQKNDQGNTLVKSGFSMMANDIATDSSKSHKYKYFDLEALNLNMNNIHYNFPDSLYSLYIKNISYALNTTKIHLDSTHISSRYDKYELAQVVNHEIDWINLYNPKAEITGVNPETIIEGLYDIDRFTFEGTDMFVFRDKRLPFPGKPDSQLPHQMLSSMNININVDTLEVKNANIEYQEILKHSEKPGKVSFTNLYASIYNLTSVDSIGKKTNYTAHMDVITDVMGKSQLKASFSFPLIASQQPYTVSGHIQDMDFTEFNPMLTQVAFVRIEHGHLIDLDFDFNYNTEQSTGTMRFKYDNLKISTLDKESNKGNGTGEDIKSFIANTFVIKKNNLKDGDGFRVGDIDYSRDKKKSVVNYWWKSLLTGFRSTVGLASPEKMVKTED